MFEQSTLENGPSRKRAWTTFAGFGTQALIVGSMILVPLVSPQVLPSVHLSAWLEPPGPPPPPPPVNHMAQVEPVRRPFTQIRDGVVTAPVSVPPIALILVDPPPSAIASSGGGVPGGIDGGQTGGTGNSILGSILGAVPPVAQPVRTVEATPPPAAPPAPIRVKVGGNVKAAILIHRVEPPYPPLAKAARISGDVQLEGVIGVNGRMIDLRIVSGHPLLVKAAYDAVRQWIYRPTTLNGDPVEVIAPITVSFRLN
ncbi:MAG TPA: energy transducer TonB [Bryobacteraceae bacterium]